MAKIQYIPPTSPPDLLANAYIGGVQAGAQVGRNRATVIEAQLRHASAMAEVAMRERVANLEAGMHIRELDAKERLAMEGMKHESEMLLSKLGTEREMRAEAMEFNNKQAEDERNFRMELLEKDPSKRMDAADLEARQGLREITDKLSSGEITAKEAAMSALRWSRNTAEFTQQAMLANAFDAGTGDRVAIGDVMPWTGSPDQAGQVLTQYHKDLNSLHQSVGAMKSLVGAGSNLDPDTILKLYSNYRANMESVNSVRSQSGKPPLPDQFPLESMPERMRNVIQQPPPPPPVQKETILPKLFSSLSPDKRVLSGLAGVDNPGYRLGRAYVDLMAPTNNTPKASANPKVSPPGSITVVRDPVTGKLRMPER